ncbi:MULTISPECIES: Bax inhibitor-1/YccA family protein [unclassified Microbacterium]|uniref:Bax inhibitor-1/YccA family protein n=1 Tax=unclassified Microbacterium TaxID=2609290 RepID=UPI00214AC0AF|nr:MULTISPECIES: Bax inhibitor-1/YccA family protein [unclassified Microbacterium]MCR2785048.1 Bax inhibitor-1/YccA family protein [Microbacterium sp. zg.B96]MDL5352417.1 Bax inhibitor-1/YccA family protein [Microbacterium sp. zg-YB36]WIM16583.1 Bax inhibitor-1/YccA family protein [Microbacterium sp. zg-B96]
MALNNPAFANPAFQEQRPGLTPPAVSGTQTQFAAAQHQGVDAASQAHLEGMYAAPPAGAIETDRMSVEDTVLKTVGLFAILMVTAVVGWIWTLSTVTVANPSPTMMPWIIGALGGFVLSLAVIFGSRKKIRPGLIFAYAALEGLFVGGISAFFEFIFPGIVMQATLATLAVVGVTLALFASGKVRASKKATKIFMIAMGGYLVFSLLNVGLMLFGVIPGDMMFGLHSATIMGIPLGLIIGVLVVIMAAYSLVLDFDQVQQGVRNGAPRKFGWMGAFGIMVTVVWLYVEILRILAIVRGSN